MNTKDLANAINSKILCRKIMSNTDRLGRISVKLENMYTDYFPWRVGYAGIAVDKCVSRHIFEQSDDTFFYCPGLNEIVDNMLLENFTKGFSFVRELPESAVDLPAEYKMNGYSVKVEDTKASLVACSDIMPLGIDRKYVFINLRKFNGGKEHCAFLKKWSFSFRQQGDLDFPSSDKSTPSFLDYSNRVIRAICSIFFLKLKRVNKEVWSKLSRDTLENRFSFISIYTNFDRFMERSQINMILKNHTLLFRPSSAVNLTYKRIIHDMTGLPVALEDLKQWDLIPDKIDEAFEEYRK